MTQRALAAHVSAGEGEITQAAISKYESGRTIPTQPVVKALARAVGVLPEFFWQGYEEAASGMPHHRKFSALSAKLRQRIEAEAKLRMQDVVSLLHADNREVSSPEDLDGWREAISSLSPTEAAQCLRAIWTKRGLLESEQGPLHPLCACVESLGVHILPFDFQTSLVDGFFLWHQGHDFIVLNASETITADRKRFTLAHELGHALLHREQFPGDEAEKEANAFASELLLPAKTIADELSQASGLADYKRLKTRWWVSIAALGHRAHDLGVLSDGDYRRFCIHLSMMGLRKHEPLCGIANDEPTRVRGVFLADLARFGAESLCARLMLAKEVFLDRYGEWLKGGAAMPQQAL